VWEEIIGANKLTNQEEVLGRRGVGEGVGEGFPMLREHAAAWVSDFDSVIGDFVVWGGDHEADDGAGLERSKGCKDSHSVHRRKGKLPTTKQGQAWVYCGGERGTNPNPNPKLL